MQSLNERRQHNVLINLIEQAAALGESSGVDVVCERTCRTLGGMAYKLTIIEKQKNSTGQF